MSPDQAVEVRLGRNGREDEVDMFEAFLDHLEHLPCGVDVRVENGLLSGLLPGILLGSPGISHVELHCDSRAAGLFEPTSDLRVQASYK